MCDCFLIANAKNSTLYARCLTVHPDMKGKEITRFNTQFGN